MNTFKTFCLMLGLFALFMGAGYAIGYGMGGPEMGASYMVSGFIFAAISNLLMFFLSDKIVLSMYGAKPLSEKEAPKIYRIVRRLCERARMPMPRIYRIPSEILNAFATGRSPQHAAVAVTDGLMEVLEEDELEGVLGHELSHVRHRDMLLATIAAMMAAAISQIAFMARWAAMFGGDRNRDRGGNPLVLLVLAILAPIAATILQLAISRTREYKADEGGAELSGNPLGLAAALRKLEMGAKRFAVQPSGAQAATASLFIVNPFRGEKWVEMFSTHPSTASRIARLEKMAERMKSAGLPRIIS